MLQLLKGARLVDPSQGIDEYKDLLIEKGRVVEILRPGEKRVAGRQAYRAGRTGHLPWFG